MRTSLRLLGAGLALLAGAASPGDDGAAGRIRAHVEYLASDALQGRDTGSQGYARAADYVAAQFRELGLEPGNRHGGWLQQVPFRRAEHAEPPSATLTFSGGKAEPLRAGHDFALRPSVVHERRSMDAPLVFVGHGISEPSLGIDEYAGLDVSGKIVVALRGTPWGLSHDIAAHLESSRERTAAAKGAAALIELSVRGYNPVAGRPGGPVLDWVDAQGSAGATADVKAAMILSPETSHRIFEGAPRSLDEIWSSSRSVLQGFPLRARLKLEARSRWQEFRSPNVVGLLRGSDPTLAAEQVVLMAHLDHLGIDPSAGPKEDSIYNGALDNAAGVATMIEAARSFTVAGARPRRSILFVATTGEERGLVGADYFAAHLPEAPARVVALVNLDMPLLTYDFTDVIGFGAEHSTIGRAVAEAGRGMGVALARDPMPEQSLFIRSDHYRFVLRGVPAIFLMTGHSNGGGDAWDRYLSRVYHRPNDEASPAIHWRAGAKFSELNYRLARMLADSPAPPRWYADGYFGQRFAPGEPRATR